MKSDKITLDHGAGGKLSHRLITGMMLPVFENAILSQLHDGAVLDLGGKKWAFSTDTFTVDPIFFPGGSIGELAVNGTVNDIAMCGAMPRFLSAGFVIEEGFPISDLEKILIAMGHAAREAGVDIVSGDTKVVPKGAVDKLFVNTSGIGIINEGVHIGSRNACPGDKIILSGSIADHGIAILTQREQMTFSSGVKSDTACLNHLVNRMLVASQQIHVLRDPTRGGVGTALNEIAVQSRVGIMIYEENILIRREVLGICELLGLDPLYIANEGKLLAFVDSSCVEAVLRVMHEDQDGKEACIIGEAVSDHPGMVWMKTRIGGTRILDMLTGDQLPRIC